MIKGTPKTVRIPRECCAEKCRKVATHARKLSDFWITTCDEHANANAKARVSINKAIEALFSKGKRA